MIQISDDFMRKADTGPVCLMGFIFAQFNTAFRQYKLLIRKTLFHHIQHLKMISAVPVERTARHHGIRMLVNHTAHPFIQPLFVMIPQKDFHIIQPGFYHGRIHICFQKQLLFPWRIHTGIPCLDSMGFILE